MLLHQNQNAPAPAVELLGDLHPLLEQLGSLDGLVTLGAAAESLGAQEVGTLAGLRAFLHDYHARILHPIELPAIQRAFGHASRQELRELIALDAQLAGEPMFRDFKSASRRVGQCQLQKLRPLRDHRLVQRYLAAVDEGQATGWHTLIYGVTLSVYSLPLRQGLLGYAHQMTRGFIQAASRPLKLSTTDSKELLEELCGRLPAAVEPLLAQSVLR